MNYKYLDVIIFSRIKIWNWQYQLSVGNTLCFEYFKECIVQFYYNLFKYFSNLFKVWIPNNILIVLKYLILEFVSSLSRKPIHAKLCWKNYGKLLRFSLNLSASIAFHFYLNSYISYPTSLRGVQMKYWSNDFSHGTDQNLSIFNKEEVDLKLPWSSGIFDSYQAFKLWHNKYLVTLKSQ